MAARSCSGDREVDHLAGEDKGSQNAHQGNHPVIGVLPDLPGGIRYRADRACPEGRTNGW